jgi:hypothetical protein
MKPIIIIQNIIYESFRTAARAFGISPNTVEYRLSKGWTPEEAVGLHPRPSFAANTPGIPVIVNGIAFKNIKEACKHFKRAYTHVIEMMQKGRSVEQALGLIKNPRTLQSENPILAQQWHPIKNLPLTPDNVTPGSGIRVWWLCTAHHEWEAVINSRNQGSGCAYCAGQKATGERNFAFLYPKLLKELDPEKNIDFDPSKVTPRGKLKVWWKCSNGHSWQATLGNRTRNNYQNSCPYCVNRKLCNDNSLALLRPDVAQDWHPFKNNDLTPHDVIAGGGIKVWWRCKHGHEWLTTVGARVNNGTGCPKCTLQTSRIEIAVLTEIQALFSDVIWREKIDNFECDILIKEKQIGIEIDGVYWHQNKAGLDSFKSKLFKQKGIQLYRLREHGLPLLSKRDSHFKWSDKTFPIIAKLIQQILRFAVLTKIERIKLQNYLNGNTIINEKAYRFIVSTLPAPLPGLSLADKWPNIAKEWAYDLNVPLTPEHFGPSANKSVWWRCINNHTWRSVIQQRTFHQTSCRKCPRYNATSENNLALIHPALAVDWHPDKNGDTMPEQITPQSNYKFWWKCKYEHEWEANVSSRARGTGCPYCYGRFASKNNNLAFVHPEILAIWDFELNKGLDPSMFTPHVNKKVWWKCNKGHSWKATINNITRNKSGCPHCARNNSRKYTIEFFQDFAAKHNGKCLSTEYISCRKNIKMICKNGHIFEIRADNILYKNKWCNICNKYLK